MADEREESAPVERTGTKQEQEAAIVEPTGSSGLKAPRPSGCKQYARKRMARAMPELMDTFLEQSKEGNLATMKLLVQLSGLDEMPAAKRPKRTDGSVKKLMDEWREAAMKRES